ncbi:hypothetical protein RR48_02663 [Papilio machaon]|uniref:Uncharacterized protein n=1 Tax=Papilio machaon TaxID=76193 RepID=A0A0N0PCV2_PAPMA|nr:hypothetical protein RR48_02663 [Papilio machaon]
MMMLLAQKNKALREKFKESKQLQRNIKTIDPDFFPTSDSDDDPAFSRFNSADQLLAPILPSSNGFDFEDSHFLSGPCTSNVDYFAMHQDDQNTEIGNNNKSPNSQPAPPPPQEKPRQPKDKKEKPNFPRPKNRTQKTIPSTNRR